MVPGEQQTPLRSTERIVPTQDSLGGYDDALQWIVDTIRSKLPSGLTENERSAQLRGIWSGEVDELDGLSPRALYDEDPNRVLRYINSLNFEQKTP